LSGGGTDGFPPHHTRRERAMATESTSSSSGGIGFCGLLGIVFITLKLCGVIDWSWWWVLLPLYGPAVLFLAVLVIAGIGAGLFCGVRALWAYIEERKWNR
jgi:hypothetical protein